MYIISFEKILGMGENGAFLLKMLGLLLSFHISLLGDTMGDK